MPTVYFICYGNICRSPFAEHYARKSLLEKGFSGLTFRSGGIGAVPGTPSPKPALGAATRLGVDLGPHRAVHVRDLRVRSEDLLVAMDRYVFSELALHLGNSLADVKGPGGAPLVLLMRELSTRAGPAPASLDVPDPMGQDMRAYLDSYSIIARAVDPLLDRLCAPTAGALPSRDT